MVNLDTVHTILFITLKEMYMYQQEKALRPSLSLFPSFFLLIQYTHMNSSDNCESCSRKVYVIEKVEANNRIYHKQCFKV